MHATRSDAAEVGANVAAIGQARTVAQQQATDHCGYQRAKRDVQARGKTPRQASRQQRPQHDAKVHDGGHVLPQRRCQRLGVGRRLPEHPAADVYTQAGESLGAPQGKCGGNAPRAPGQGQGGVVQQGQGNSAPQQRPWATHEASQALVFTAHGGFQSAMAALFQYHRGPGDQREHRHAGQQRRRYPPGLDDRGSRQRWQGEPPVGMVRGSNRADDEEQQRHQHSGVAPADGEQRARGTTAAQLHADTEDKRAKHHRNPGWRHQPGHRVTKQAASRQRREEQQHGQGQHDHLRTQAGASSFVDEYAPGRGETERCVVERQPQGGADDQQQYLLEPGIEVEEPGTSQQQGQGNQGGAQAARFGCCGCGKTHRNARITVKRGAIIAPGFDQCCFGWLSSVAGGLPAQQCAHLLG